MRRLEILDPQDWNESILQLESPHVLQTWEWGLSKTQHGWQQAGFVWESTEGKLEAAAMLLSREVKILPGLAIKVLYCPKGPVLNWENKALVEQVIGDLVAYTKKSGAIFLKIDPDIELGRGVPGTETETSNANGQATLAYLKDRGFIFSQDQIQFRNTVFIDLDRSEEELLAAMKQKTRYNIRLAERKGVKVRQGSLEDLPMLYSLYASTGVRDGFVVRHEAYYTELWSRFIQAGKAKVLIAEFEGKPIAALILFYFAGVARYIYGMSLDAHRELMPNYLLQWEAIKLAKSLGCKTYDFWGAPDEFNERDSLWGVYRFKDGFNGTTTRHIGAWDHVARPGLYKLYTRILPELLNIFRRLGKALNRKKVYSD